MTGAVSERRFATVVPLPVAAHRRRGQLTVFLGMAPGVGKSYAMLERARALRGKGKDVVIGLVETHGRSDTALMGEGLETLPRVNGAGACGEFDIDAALGRHPQLLIVDDLAHSNPPGARHPKRYQDIVELIDAGIDVWTAINIQHLESLCDLIARIAGVPVRETVPDFVLKQADEIVLVDLPPAELIERLEAGKVYLPDNAGEALEGFFQPTTLTALRELSLRRAADQTDDQMVDFLRQAAIDGPWANSERLLVCVGPDDAAERVVREASRLASGLNARWTVLCLSRSHGVSPDATAMYRLDASLHLAERLGAQIRRDVSDDFVEAILKAARRENATQIVIGRSARRFRWRRSLPDALLQRAGDIGVHIVPPGATRPVLHRKRQHTLAEWLLAIGLPILTVGATTLLGLGLSAPVALQTLAMLYLAAVLISAILAGRLSALLGAALSFLAYNFFFIEPTGRLTIAQPEEMLSLAIFAAVALAAGQLAALLRLSMGRTQRQSSQTQALLDLARKLSGAYGYEQVVETIASHLNGALKRACVVLVPDETGELELAAAWPPDQALDTDAMSAARWAADKREPAGFLTSTLPQVSYLLRPIQSGQRVIGVVGLSMRHADGQPSEEEQRTITALVEQSAIALDRARLTREITSTTVVREGQKVQGALLSSLSHDLRTPLASITGAVATLRRLGDRMPAESRADLLLSIELEADHLNRFVSNLFEMSRIEAGIASVRLSPVDVAATIAAAVARAERVHPLLEVSVSLAEDLPPACADAALLEQVLFNLLDNAAKYAGEKPVTVYARAEGQDVSIAVTDQGKGIAEGELERIFEKFYRRAKGDGRQAGTGLGLAIARGFVTAMGGTIRAESPAYRRHGTRFTVRLPRAEESAA